jgi:hypothetical protein
MAYPVLQPAKPACRRKGTDATGHRWRMATDPKPKKAQRPDEDEGDTAVEEVVELFTAHGDEDSPASDSDAPPPG